MSRRIELPEGREPSPAERDRAVRAAYPPHGSPDLEVADDVGTTYRSVPTGGPFHEFAQGHDVVVAWAGERFRPAVPEGASELRVGFEGACFKLSVAA